MTEQSPDVFTVPTAGRYHFISGHEPHLVKDCTEECKTFDGTLKAKTGSTGTLKMETTPFPDLSSHAAPITFTNDEDGNPVPQWPKP